MSSPSQSNTIQRGATAPALPGSALPPPTAAQDNVAWVDLTDAETQLRRAFENVLGPISSFLTPHDTRVLGSATTWLQPYLHALHPHHLDLLANKAKGRTQRGLQGLMTRPAYSHVTHLTVTNTSSQASAHYVLPTILECCLAPGHGGGEGIKLKSLSLDGQLLTSTKMVSQVVSLVEAGALAHLEELRIRRHRALQFVFRSFFLSLVHCPRLRLLGLGDSGYVGVITSAGYIRQVLQEALQMKGFPRIEVLELEDDMLQYVRTSLRVLPMHLCKSLQVTNRLLITRHVLATCLSIWKEWTLRTTPSLHKSMYFDANGLGHDTFPCLTKLVLDSQTSKACFPSHILSHLAERAPNAFPSLTHLEVRSGLGEDDFLRVMLRSPLGSRLTTLILHDMTRSSRRKETKPRRVSPLCSAFLTMLQLLQHHQGPVFFLRSLTSLSLVSDVRPSNTLSLQPLRAAIEQGRLPALQSLALKGFDRFEVQELADSLPHVRPEMRLVQAEGRR